LTAEEVKEIANSVEGAIGDRYPHDLMAVVYNQRL
jgi:hypothetical protein